jgi:hypothetical protein
MRREGRLSIAAPSSSAGRFFGEPHEESVGVGPKRHGHRSTCPLHHRSLGYFPWSTFMHLSRPPVVFLLAFLTCVPAAISQQASPPAPSSQPSTSTSPNSGTGSPSSDSGTSSPLPGSVTNPNPAGNPPMDTQSPQNTPNTGTGSNGNGSTANGRRNRTTNPNQSGQQPSQPNQSSQPTQTAP